MAITVPVIGTEIDVVAFGAPVANLCNSVGAVANKSVPGTTVAGGANSSIYSQSFTTPATVVGLLAILTLGFTTPATGDILAMPSQTIVGSVNVNTPGSTVTFLFAASGGTTLVAFNIFAWGGSNIVIDTAKSRLTLMAATANVTGTTFP